MRLCLARPSGRVLALHAAAATLLSSALAAQSGGARDSVRVTVTGVVWTPVNVVLAGARVAVVPRPGDDSVPAVITDDNGTFRFADVRPGRLTLAVRRVGFGSTTVQVDVPSADGGPLLVELAPVAPLLTPVLVRADRVVSNGPFAGFHQRRASGFGRFITRAEIERAAPMRTTDLFRMVPGARLGSRSHMSTPSVRFRGANCDPEVVLDGMTLGPVMLDLDALAPNSIEGIEVYSGAATVPTEFKKGFGRSSCGMIVVWTRRGEPRPRRPKKGEAAITAAGLADLVAASSVYTADQVDVAARPDGDISALITYPDTLRGADRVAASGVVEFVVDSSGRVELRTINFVSVPSRPFVGAIRAAVPDMRFTPAVKNGARVRQVVQLVVQFDPAAKPGVQRPPE